MAITEKDALLKDRKLGVTVINNRLDLPKYGKRTDNTIHRTTVESQKKFVEIEWFYGVLVVVALNLVLQAVISIGSHSGFGQPPLHGDYEAQRHWMEVTINLPIKEWYFNTSDNDLNYWGLDYPPLTAYHSWLMGKISYLLNPEWVALHTSRGIELPEHKLFMRISVIVGTFLVYTSAILYLHKLVYKRSNTDIDLKYFAAIICYPGIMFIDNGHFQFNHISLGLFLWSIYYFHQRRYLIGSIFYTLALNYKQMELYHALPIFVFLLSSLKHVSQLGIVVIGIFFIVWLPFLTDLNVAKQVLIRIFPLDRGIFEDKVANFWCSISALIKIKEIYDKNFLAKLSALLVLTTNLPSLYVLFRRSSEKNLRICLVISSLAFYLFSFQVHEKSILLCTIPALFILNEFPNAILSFLSTSIFSMYHLCIKDGMPEILPLFILYTLFLWSLDSNKLWKFYHMANLVISLLICGLLLFGKTPARYPYLFELFLAVYCFSQFFLLFIYLNYQIVYSNYFMNSSIKNKKV